MRTLLIFLLICINASAKTVRGHIYNITDNAPIANVTIRNTKTSQQTISDNSGAFSIEGSPSDTIVCIHNDYSVSELTIANIENSRNNIYLFPQPHQTLPEVTVTAIDMYSIYKKAIANLKNRLITNQPVAYRCIGTEKEINIGDERRLAMEFTASLENANPKRKKLNYSFLLADLQVDWDLPKSDIMKDDKLRNFLFYVAIPNTLKTTVTNTLTTTDSTFIIYHRLPTRAYIYTINKSDTTLTQIIAEAISINNKYTHLRTFKGKEIEATKTIVFKKSAKGYYLDHHIINNEYSFLLGKPQKEERIIISYKTYAIPGLQLNAAQKFNPTTRDLYRMNNKTTAEDDKSEYEL